jgi:hypothetical protein
LKIWALLLRFAMLITPLFYMLFERKCATLYWHRWLRLLFKVRHCHAVCSLYYDIDIASTRHYCYVYAIIMLIARFDILLYITRRGEALFMLFSYCFCFLHIHTRLFHIYAIIRYEHYLQSAQKTLFAISLLYTYAVTAISHDAIIFMKSLFHASYHFASHTTNLLLHITHIIYRYIFMSILCCSRDIRYEYCLRTSIRAHRRLAHLCLPLLFSMLPLHIILFMMFAATIWESFLCYYITIITLYLFILCSWWYREYMMPAPYAKSYYSARARLRVSFILYCFISCWEIYLRYYLHCHACYAAI